MVTDLIMLGKTVAKKVITCFSILNGSQIWFVSTLIRVCKFRKVDFFLALTCNRRMFLFRTT